MTTSVDEVIEFLGIAGSKGFLNENTVVARRTACNKFFDILEPSQRTVEYVRENLEVLKSRFSNLNKDVRGNTVDEYARRVQLVLTDFVDWSNDRAAWERKVAARQSNRTSTEADKGNRASRTTRQKKSGAGKEDSNGQSQSENEKQDPSARIVAFPIRPDFETSIKIPREGLTIDELKRLVYFLLPYAQDWEPSESPRSVFPMLEREDTHI